MRALTRIEEFNEFFGASLDDQNYDTVGGLVMHELGRLPRKGEIPATRRVQFPRAAGGPAAHSQRRGDARFVGACRRRRGRRLTCIARRREARHCSVAS